MDPRRTHCDCRGRRWHDAPAGAEDTGSARVSLSGDQIVPARRLQRDPVVSGGGLNIRKRLAALVVVDVLHGGKAGDGASHVGCVG